MKQCSKCKTNKTLNEFGKSKSRNDGLYHWCKECVKIDNTKRRKTKEKGTKWKLDLQNNGLKFCPICSNIKLLCDFGFKKNSLYGLQPICRNCKSIKDSEYRERLKNEGRYKDMKKSEYQKNKTKYREAGLIYNKEKRDYKKEYKSTLILRNKNPLAKLRNVVRNRLLVGLKYRGFKKNSPTIDILGADWSVIEKHISDKFTDGMNWENHGRYGWHIDHIIPLSNAKNEKEFYELCHYMNLQPLWFLDNLEKGTKTI